MAELTNVVWSNAEHEGSICCVIDGKSWCVPIDSENSHYQLIQAWVAEGNTIEEPS